MDAQFEIAENETHWTFQVANWTYYFLFYCQVKSQAKPTLSDWYDFTLPGLPHSPDSTDQDLTMKFVCAGEEEEKSVIIIHFIE